MGDVDVVIVTYDSAGTVAEAIASVAGSPLVNAVIVVDNASQDASADVADQAGSTLVIRNKDNRGFAAAVNQGLREGAGEYVLLLNPDARLEGPSLGLLVAALAERPEAALAGPLLVAPDGGVVLGARRFSSAANRLLSLLPMPWRPRWSTPEYRDAAAMAGAQDPQPVDYLWGAALLARRTFLEEVGGLDERFFLYSEDEDLGRQARARGLRSLLVPRARAAHEGGASTPDAARATAGIIRANTLLLDKWEGKGPATVYRCAILLVLAARIVLLLLASRRAQARLAYRTWVQLRAVSDPAPRA